MRSGHQSRAQKRINKGNPFRPPDFHFSCGNVPSSSTPIITQSTRWVTRKRALPYLKHLVLPCQVPRCIKQAFLDIGHQIVSPCPGAPCDDITQQHRPAHFSSTPFLDHFTARQLDSSIGYKASSNVNAVVLCCVVLKSVVGGEYKRWWCSDDEHHMLTMSFRPPYSTLVYYSIITHCQYDRRPACETE